MKKALYAALIIATAVTVYYLIDLWEFDMALDLVKNVKELMSN